MVAGWEAATDQKIAQNAVMREYSALQAERSDRLHARRAQLAQKLYAEEAAMQAELMSSRVTPEEKRAALAARAKGLWEAREAERQATANSLLERHFRCVTMSLAALNPPRVRRALSSQHSAAVSVKVRVSSVLSRQRTAKSVAVTAW